MINDKFLEAIKEYKLIEPGDAVLVAVSGGADSTALLNLLYSYRDKLKISLHVAHLNHMLRRGDAELDVRFVEQLSRKMELPFITEAVDVAALAEKSKMGIEAAARAARYEFFERAAEKIGADRIAVGHTADDNIETFLMRLLRGSGIRGLCGIPPKRGKIVRPLIKIWRREIEDYVGSLKLVPRRDHTNYESKYIRNSVRLKLVPQLKVYNLNIKEIILQTILLLTEDSLYLESCADARLAETLRGRDGNGLRISIPRFKELEPAIQGHALRIAIERVKGDLNQLAFGHIRDILDKLGSTEKWELHLPGNIFVSGNRDEMTIGCERPAARAEKSFKYSLTVPGEVKIDEINRVVRCGFAERVEKNAGPNCAFVDYTALGKEITVRSKLPGDRFSPLGVRGTKKVQDFFVDEKVPLDERDAVPVVESGGKIVWVAGMRLDDRAKVTEKTKKIVKLEIL